MSWIIRKSATADLDPEAVVDVQMERRHHIRNTLNLAGTRFVAKSPVVERTKRCPLKT